MGITVHFFGTFHDATVVWILLNVVCIFVVEMRIMSHAAESIRREFQGKTWDLLILTGVNTWRLILGKWSGAIRGNRREILFLYFLRVMTFFWAMILSNLRLDGFGWYNSRSNYPTAYIWDIRFDVDALMMGAIIMAVFLALEIMLVASLPLVFSLFKRTRNSATWIALGLRIGLPLAFGLLILWSAGELESRLGTVKHEYKYSDTVSIRYSNEVQTGLAGLATVLGDNGYTLTAFFFEDTYWLRDVSAIPFFLSQFLGIGLYLLWIWIMLWLAEAAAFAHNVSLPGFVPKTKPKRLIQAEQTTTNEPTTPAIPQPKPRSPRESNLLGIQNPALYRCEVLRYADAQLEVAVYRMTERSPDFIVRFGGVSFFIGAMSWTNAKFEELEDSHLRQYASNQKLDADKLLVGSRLYVVQSQGNRTRIIATDVHVEEM